MFHHQTIQFNASIVALLYCSADLFSTTPGRLRLCVGCLHVQVSSHPVSAANPHLLRFSQICPRLLHFGHFLCFGGIAASQLSLRIRPIYF